jgi:hypothetical protein
MNNLLLGLWHEACDQKEFQGVIEKVIYYQLS